MADYQNSAGMESQARAQEQIHRSQMDLMMRSQMGTASSVSMSIAPEPSGVIEQANALVQEIAITRSLFASLEERIGHTLRDAGPECEPGDNMKNPVRNMSSVGAMLDVARQDLNRLRRYITQVTDRIDL